MPWVCSCGQRNIVSGLPCLACDLVPSSESAPSNDIADTEVRASESGVIESTGTRFRTESSDSADAPATGSRFRFTVTDPDPFDVPPTTGTDSSLLDQGFAAFEDPETSVVPELPTAEPSIPTDRADDTGQSWPDVDRRAADRRRDAVERRSGDRREELSHKPSFSNSGLGSPAESTPEPAASSLHDLDAVDVDDGPHELSGTSQATEREDERIGESWLSSLRSHDDDDAASDIWTDEPQHDDTADRPDDTFDAADEMFDTADRPDDMFDADTSSLVWKNELSSEAPVEVTSESEDELDYQLEEGSWPVPRSTEKVPDWFTRDPAVDNADLPWSVDEDDDDVQGREVEVDLSNESDTGAGSPSPLEELDTDYLDFDVLFPKSSSDHDDSNDDDFEWREAHRLHDSKGTDEDAPVDDWTDWSLDDAQGAVEEADADVTESEVPWGWSLDASDAAGSETAAWEDDWMAEGDESVVGAASTSTDDLHTDVPPVFTYDRADPWASPEESTDDYSGSDDDYSEWSDEERSTETDEEEDSDPWSVPTGQSNAFSTPDARAISGANDATRPWWLQDSEDTEEPFESGRQRLGRKPREDSEGSRSDQSRRREPADFFDEDADLDEPDEFEAGEDDWAFVADEDDDHAPRRQHREPRERRPSRAEAARKRPAPASNFQMPSILQDRSKLTVILAVVLVIIVLSTVGKDLFAKVAAAPGDGDTGETCATLESADSDGSRAVLQAAVVGSPSGMTVVPDHQASTGAVDFTRALRSEQDPSSALAVLDSSRFQRGYDRQFVSKSGVKATVAVYQFAGDVCAARYVAAHEGDAAVVRSFEVPDLSGATGVVRANGSDLSYIVRVQRGSQVVIATWSGDGSAAHAVSGVIDLARAQWSALPA